MINLINEVAATLGVDLYVRQQFLKDLVGRYLGVCEEKPVQAQGDPLDREICRNQPRPSRLQKFWEHIRYSAVIGAKRSIRSRSGNGDPVNPERVHSDLEHRLLPWAALQTDELPRLTLVRFWRLPGHSFPKICWCHPRDH